MIIGPKRLLVMELFDNDIHLLGGNNGLLKLNEYNLVGIYMDSSYMKICHCLIGYLVK